LTFYIFSLTSTPNVKYLKMRREEVVVGSDQDFFSDSHREGYIVGCYVPVRTEALILHIQRVGGHFLL